MTQKLTSGVIETYIDNNIFVNCPFDDEYKPLLRPLLFTIVYLGKNPRIASERSDSGENRIDKICELISESRYSIHDLSRLKSEHADEFYRLNLPFEFGIDYGARLFGSDPLNTKKHLILEKDPYNYKIAISDISGVDIKNHKGEPDEIVRAVRDWFYETVGINEADYTKVIWNRFIDFSTALFDNYKDKGLSDHEIVEEIKKMPIAEYLNYVKLWVDEYIKSP
jgi:hypothetical protein